jgi:hypothetical protein
MVMSSSSAAAAVSRQTRRIAAEKRLDIMLQTGRPGS